MYTACTLYLTAIPQGDPFLKTKICPGYMLSIDQTSHGFSGSLLANGLEAKDPW